MILTQIFLVIISIVSALFAAFAFLAAQSVMHQIVGGIALLIFVVCITGNGVLNLLEKIHQAQERDERSPQQHLVAAAQRED